MPSLVFITTYSLGILSLLINIFINPVFLKSINIYPFYFLIVITIIGIPFLFKQKIFIQNTGMGNLFIINKLLLLPCSLFATITLTILELTHYPNYIFSTLRIFHFDFIYIFLLSYLTYLLGIGKESIIKNYKKHIFILSLVLLFFFAIIFTWPNDFHVLISKEDGILENFQFLFYFIAGSISLFSTKLVYKSKILPGKIYFLLGLALILIAFEEISWGQRITNYSIPVVEQTNYKGETNIHNQSFIGLLVLQTGYIVAGFYGSFFYLFLNKSKRWVNLLAPSLEFFIYYIVLFLVYTYFIPINRIYQEEVAETLFSLGTMIFLLRNSFLLRTKRILNTQ